jgi:hypothetical protein
VPSERALASRKLISMLLDRANRTSVAITRSLFDSTRNYDYIAAIIFAAVPIGAAALTGLLHDRNGFTGYLSSKNWLSLVAVLPVVLWILRWVVRTLLPSDGNVPPIVRLFGVGRQQELATKELSDIFLSPINLYIAFCVMLILQATDFAEVAGLYVRRFLHASHLQMQDIREPDWTVMRILDIHVGPVLANLGVTVTGYAVQFTVGLLAFFIVILLVRHNLYFVSRIYQRRRANRNSNRPYIVVDWDHGDACFGFGGANHAFNCEIRILAAAGALVLASRFHNIPALQSQTVYNALPVLLKVLKLDFNDVGKLRAIPDTLPDAGQWILVLSWVFLLGVIAIPALVKFLPFGADDGLDMNRTSYLKEFVPEERWPGDDKIDDTAKKFAKNSFWPTGDNRALWLFGIAMTVFFVMALPLRPIRGDSLELAACYATMIALGFGTATVVFRLLRVSLAYISKTLVETSEK